ncbi:MAG: OmpH family outer membrane protein [Proteobacteria bacterium]|nr:OmpH family outer membrane protein [Pseudomonadota bacterium]
MGKSIKAAIAGIGFVALVPFLSLGSGMISTAVAQSNLPQAVISVVNIDHILKVSKPSKVATEEINAKLKAVDDLLKKRGEELQKEKQDLDKQRAIISPDAYRKKIETLNQEFQSLQRDSQVARAEFNKIIQDYRLRLRELITRQAAEVSAERGVNIGMDSARIVFFDNTMDITEEVLERFNNSNPEPLKITVEQGSAGGEKKN